MTLRLCFVKLFCAEVDLQHSAIWMAGVYLMLLMQFFENKVAVELTRSEFVEAQEVGIMPSLLPCLISLLFFFGNFAFLGKWGVGGEWLANFYLHLCQFLGFLFRCKYTIWYSCLRLILKFFIAIYEMI